MVTSGGSGILFGNTKVSAANNSNPGSVGQIAGAAPKQPGENWIFLFRSDLQKSMDSPAKSRLMTINECRDSVLALFDSKQVANSKSEKSGALPVETMETHVYKVMEKKYGLRSLAAEHTGMLLTSVKRYSLQDNDILLFMKVFSNEVEEEFRDVQAELRRSITDLLRVQLMAR